jgi:hypothetical protein
LSPFDRHKYHRNGDAILAVFAANRTVFLAPNSLCLGELILNVRQAEINGTFVAIRADAKPPGRDFVSGAVRRAKTAPRVEIPVDTLVVGLGVVAPRCGGGSVYGSSYQAAGVDDDGGVGQERGGGGRLFF